MEALMDRPKGLSIPKWILLVLLALLILGLLLFGGGGGSSSTVPTPPPSNYCGEDIARLFALNLIIDSAANFVSVESLGAFELTNMGQALNQAKVEREAILSSLASKDCHFYDKGGGYSDVSSDYQLVRNAQFGTSGLRDWALKNLSTGMNFDELLAICLKIVQAWWH